ncbi:hypothetical protein D3C78_1523850 [compost metagenome]
MALCNSCLSSAMPLRSISSTKQRNGTPMARMAPRSALHATLAAKSRIAPAWSPNALLCSAPRHARTTARSLGLNGRCDQSSNTCCQSATACTLSACGSFSRPSTAIQRSALRKRSSQVAHSGPLTNSSNASRLPPQRGSRYTARAWIASKQPGRAISACRSQ